MDHEYPIEQPARSIGTRFQMGFARMTVHLLPEFEEVLLEASGEGLRIVARNETALTLPGELIRQIHAENVAMGAPWVRVLHGDPVQEPVMWVRVAVRRQYTEQSFRISSRAPRKSRKSTGWRCCR